MIEHLQEPADHKIYADNFFTSYNLLVHLRCLGVRVTGTVRTNRTAKYPLKEDKAMKKEERGDMDNKFDVEEEILIVKRNDSSIVNAETNHQTIKPFANAKRWSTSLKQAVTIPHPQLIASVTNE